MPGVSQGSYNHDNKLIIGPSYSVMDLLKQFQLQLARSSQVCQLIIGSEKIAFTIIKQIKGMLVLVVLQVTRQIAVLNLTEWVSGPALR